METTEERLRRYVTEYARTYWGELFPEGQEPRPDDADVISIEVRSDGYANAHVEGEHEANGLCSFKSARECGERMAASEFVECG